VEAGRGEWRWRRTEAPAEWAEAGKTGRAPWWPAASALEPGRRPPPGRALPRRTGEAAASAPPSPPVLPSPLSVAKVSMAAGSGVEQGRGGCGAERMRGRGGGGGGAEEEVAGMISRVSSGAPVVELG
jgi:hypothetical protein